MELFLGSLLIALALVVSAWIRLAPSADERRLAALREAAVRQGLKLRLVSGMEAERLILPAGLTWYGLELPQAVSGIELTCVAVRRDSVWQWVEGVCPDALFQDAPAGVYALKVGGGLLQAAWNEREGDGLNPLTLWLDGRRACLSEPTHFSFGFDAVKS